MGLDAILVTIVRPLIRHETRRAVATALGAGASRTVFAMTKALYREYSRSIPRESTIGARVMVRLAAHTAALFRSLLHHEVPDAKALRLTAEITWRVYRKLAWLPWAVTRLRSRDPLSRVRMAMDLFMRFPYARPGYRMHYVDCGDQTVGFDVHRCPVSEYFARAGLSKLCSAAFCDLDFPLADKWGLELHRGLTLSKGDAHCAFRYHPRKPS